jgi:hypothetical protein
MTNLTPASLSLFISLAKDAPNWNGQPLLDITKAQRGNLTDLKKNDLLTTFKDDGCDFVIFTDAGKAFAAQNGFPIN